MARSYYSTVFEQSADEVWAVIRDFGFYEWAGVSGEAYMEDGRAGDAVGGVRNFQGGAKVIRQRLLAHSDLERCYTYEFCDAIPYPVDNYQATLRITPVVEQNRAFIEWWATFDCDPNERDRWVRYFEQEGFATWLAALCSYLSKYHGA